MPSGIRSPRRGRPIDGVLLLDKPAGRTSHDAVIAARRALKTRRIGHAGTLDPFATGLLVLLVGRATRLLQYIDGEPKVYEASIRFGEETDTDDSTGAVIRAAPLPESNRVREAVDALTGELDQLPPAYSAKQVAGRRAYDAAREGEPLELRASRVTVHDWKLHRLAPDAVEATITCSGGTYVRALARDLGRLAGSAAHLARLRRTESGRFRVADALALDALTAEGAAAIRPMNEALAPLPLEPIDEESARRISRGQTIAAGHGGPRAALVDQDRNVLAIAERVGDVWQPRVVLTDG